MTGAKRRRMANPQNSIVSIRDISAGMESTPILWENLVDRESPPTFEYITENVKSAEFVEEMLQKAQQPISRPCTCNPCSAVCPCASPYIDGATQRLVEGITIERYVTRCSKLCHRNHESCASPYVHSSLPFRLQLFKTANRGWAVRTLDRIPAGAHVVGYLGEMIATAEAEEGDDTYYYDTTVEGRLLIISSLTRGNISRFVNHSCEANLWPVSVLAAGAAYPTVEFHANVERPIEAGEELTLDYGAHYWSVKCTPFKPEHQHQLPSHRPIRCKCGTTSCKYGTDEQYIDFMLNYKTAFPDAYSNLLNHYDLDVVEAADEYMQSS